jgi:hypothetical protein
LELESVDLEKKFSSREEEEENFDEVGGET